MAKQRKPSMTNKEIINKLIKAGYIKSCNIEFRTDEFSTNKSKWWSHRYVWDKINSCSHYEKKWHYVNSYMIPIDIYKKHVVKKFKPQFEVGTQIRIREETTRMFNRNKHSQDVGDSQDFKHLGIGSGKEYHSERMDEAYVSFFYSYDKPSTKLKIGEKFCSNLLGAIDKANYYKNKGIKREFLTWNSRISHRDFQPNDFFHHTIIRGNGVFGEKKLINGYITNVFVHFLYPKWEKKREARYEVTLDTGAMGIFTNDYLEQVYDTDIELDEKLMDGCHHQRECLQSHNCDHILVHNHSPECDQPCFNSGYPCQAIYDYTNFFDTTHGMALDIEKEDKDG